MASTATTTTGLTGLINLGNTCFINTTIQVLCYIHELHDLKPNANIVDDSVLLHEWHSLRGLMYSENCTVRPAKFINCIQIVARKKQQDQFADLEQSDMTEFFLFLVDCFHNALSRPMVVSAKGTTKNSKLCNNLLKETFAKEYSEIYDIFYGVHLSQIKSMDGKKLHASKPEYFQILDLAITAPTLDGCLQNYLDGEILDGDNQWFNEEKNVKMDVRKSLLFWKLPKILVVAFKRFTNNFHKNQTIVDFPHDDFVLHTEKSSVSYDLFAVVNHYGVMLGGHYTAFLKNGNGKWYEYNDTIVTQVSPANIVTPRAYCLFYRRKG